MGCQLAAASQWASGHHSALNSTTKIPGGLRDTSVQLTDAVGTPPWRPCTQHCDLCEQRGRLREKPWSAQLEAVSANFDFLSSIKSFCCNTELRTVWLVLFLFVFWSSPLASNVTHHHPILISCCTARWSASQVIACSSSPSILKAMHVRTACTLSRGFLTRDLGQTLVCMHYYDWVRIA